MLTAAASSGTVAPYVRLTRAGVQWDVTTFLTLRAARHCRPGCRAQTGSEACLPSGPVASYDLGYAAKVFGIVYALFSRVAFLTMVAMLLAPAAHRLLHRFHLEQQRDDS